MTNDDRNGVNAAPEKIDPEEQASNDLPDLTRLYKRRCRDGDIMQKCKHMLIAGMPPGKVALMLRLPLEKVQSLFEASYNPRCRRFAKTNAYTNARLALTSFLEGADLSDICHALGGLSLYWVVTSLRQSGITDAAMAPRFPPYDDQSYVEYRRVCERKAASKFKTIQISPVRRVRKSQQASQQATA
jgi:hypothetical protein